MNKTRITTNKCIVLILTCLLLGSVLFFWRNNQATSFLGVRQIETPATTDAAYAGELLLNGIPVPRDSATGIYYLSQIMGNPKWQGHLTVEGYNQSLYVEKDSYIQNKSSAISEGHSFTLYVKESNQYHPLSLVISGLPVIELSYDSFYEPGYTEDNPDLYYFSNETRYVGHATVINSSGRDDRLETIYSPVEFHTRGATSSIYDKTGYAFKLMEEDGSGYEVPLLGMEEGNSWKLINLYTDKSKLRDMVSLKLWKEIAESNPEYIETGADMEYCELVVDHKYLGLYGLVKPIDEDTLKLADKDVLYKVISADPPSESALEHSIKNRYTVAYPLRMRYPKDMSEDQIAASWIPIKNYLTYAYWYPDANLYASQLDLRNLTDFYIFIAATAASDNQFKNTYISSRYLSDFDAYMNYIIPWDLNYSFGDIYVYDPDQLYTVFESTPEVLYSEPCISQLFAENIGGAKDLLRDKYNIYRRGTLSTEHIKQLFHSNQQLLIESGAFERDSFLWPEANNSLDLEAIDLYIEKHMNYLDECFME